MQMVALSLQFLQLLLILFHCVVLRVVVVEITSCYIFRLLLPLLLLLRRAEPLDLIPQRIIRSPLLLKLLLELFDLSLSLSRLFYPAGVLRSLAL